MYTKYSTEPIYKCIVYEMSLTSIEVDTRSSQNLQGDGQLMTISCTPPISEVNTATCVIPALTGRVTAEIFPCMTLGQILASENLSEDQRYLIEMCIEAERYEEELDEQLKDSMFIVFPSLEAFRFRNTVIRQEDI